MVESYFEKEKEKNKEGWRQAAFIASWIINTAGKSYEKDVSADELIGFKDEIKKEKIKPIDPEERKKQADESFMLHKKAFWTLLSLDKDGKVKVFDKEKLEEIRKRYNK